MNGCIVGRVANISTKTILASIFFFGLLGNVNATPWTGVANCRATPPLASEASELPGPALVGTVMSMLKGGAVAIAYPGSSNKDYQAWYPYVCVIAGDFSKAGAPQVGQWVQILFTKDSSYSNYAWHLAAALAYTDPAGASGYTEGGPTTTGFNADWQYCNEINVPQAALTTIEQRSCFSQAFEHGLCVTYPHAQGHPTLVIFDQYNNNSGQYCPNVYGGQIDATVCGTGAVRAGVGPC